MDDSISAAGPSNGNRNNANGGADIVNQNGGTSVDMFKEVCGVNDELAAQLLRESGGNLEAAIHQFFYTNENPEAEVLENQDNEHQELRQRRFVGVQANVPAAVPNNPPNQLVPNEPMGWGRWFRALVLLPFRFFYSTFNECLIFFYNLLIVGPPNQRIIPNRNRRPIQQQQNVIQDRMIMRAQQDEYNQALAIDRQKAQERKRQEDQKREEEKQAREEAERLQARSARMEQKKVEIGKIMSEPEAGEPGLIRIRFSFPSGTKMERRFRHDHSLERLFEAVFVHPECPENFSLLTSYPSVLLHCAPDWYREEFEQPADAEGPIKTFADHGLVSSVIIVQDNDA